MDIFTSRGIRPMHFFQTSTPFDSTDWLYELHLPGIRCLAYLDSSETDLRSFDNQAMLPFLPELTVLHHQVKHTCALDGVLTVLRNGIPDESALWQRIKSGTLDKKQLPLASYVAYDLLYVNDQLITHLPLLERKAMLEDLVSESVDLTISRYQEDHCNELLKLAMIQRLNGVIAKRKDSVYQMDQTTNHWIQFLTIPLIHSVVCGFLRTLEGRGYFIFGQYKEDTLIYQGCFPTFKCQEPLNLMHYMKEKRIPIHSDCPCSILPIFDACQELYWFEPKVVCLFELPPNAKPKLANAFFRGICGELTAKDCQTMLFR